MIAIRPADAGDCAAIWAMLEPVFRAGETYCIPRDIDEAEAIAFWHGPGHDVFVAEEGEPLGSYFLRPNKKGPGAHVANAAFVTARAAEGRGVARAMLAHCLEAARKRGFRAMQFNAVVASNRRAVALWERGGFVVVGRVPEGFLRPDGTFDDMLVMHRHL